MMGKVRFRVACIVGFIAICATSCTKRIYVPVENVKYSTDTIMVYKQYVDTVIDRDSLSVEIKGDTIVRQSVKWRYRIKVHNDTLYRNHTDSIRIEVPYPVEKIKEVNKLYIWQKMLIIIGIFTLIYIVIKVIKFR